MVIVIVLYIFRANRKDKKKTLFWWSPASPPPPPPPQLIHSPVNSVLGRKLWKATMTSVSVEENSFNERNEVKRNWFFNVKYEINCHWSINSHSFIYIYVLKCCLECRFCNRCLDVLLTDWSFILLIKFFSCQSYFLELKLLWCFGLDSLLMSGLKQYTGKEIDL